MIKEQLLAENSELSRRGIFYKRMAQFQIVGGAVMAPVGISLFFFGIVNETIMRFLIGDMIFMFTSIGIYPVGGSATLSQSRIFSILVCFFGIYQMAMGLLGVPI